MDELNTDLPIYINANEKSEKLKIIKKIIKDQYDATCKCQFSREYVLNSLTKFDHGFVLLSRRQANYGSKMGRKDLYNLKSFILFTYNSFNRTINGLILCSVKNTNEVTNGRRLMDCVFKFGYENNALLWALSSLPYEKLQNFNANMGFIYTETLYERGVPKIYRMDYKFTEENRIKFYEWLSTYRLTSDTYNICFQVSTSPIKCVYESKNDRIIQGMLLFIDMYNETSRYNKAGGETISYTLNSELVNTCNEEQIGYISEYETKDKTKIMLKGNLDADEYDKFLDIDMKDRHSTIFIMVNSEKTPLYEEYLEGINIMAKFMHYKMESL